ncbi:MAG: carbamoyl-phosphate synthase large subunit [Kiritimatiellae bacterium]|nr:carbamoyl-phosphate synthase large subunit [Kiritimatiellia bacterium]
MKRTDIRKILIIGSGPIVIGQGCEFDYSGCQAVKALRHEGYEIVLVNSNPATVMTDPEMAEATYIEPLTVDSVSAIIRKERPNALLPTLGGQTALNLAMELKRSGILEKHGVEMIGADADAIARAEDRNLFKAAMSKLGLDMPKSGSAHSLAEAEAIAKGIESWPLIIRPGFTLGGTGGGIAHDEAEFREIATRGLDASLNHEVLIEESLIGWKEFEMEVMRDKAGNSVIVCSIENMDPMGVHTGDSITVAPIQTLTDREYQAMRDDSIRVLEAIGIATGGSNVQWAVNPKTGRRIIIEMNPRVSRSSALASKATGFPIAKIAALLSVGYTLDELKNDITEVTPACFEPALDYVVVKVPRFTFEKFPGADRRLGTQMKSVGEAMAIGRTFKQAYLKAVRSLEAPLAGHDPNTFDPWFKAQLEEMEAFRKWLGQFHLAAKSAEGAKTRNEPGKAESICGLCDLCDKKTKALDAEVLRQAKVFGFSDREIAEAIGCDEITVRMKRLNLGIRPEYGAVDTCAGEFEARTPYYYSYYSTSDFGPRASGLAAAKGQEPRSPEPGVPRPKSTHRKIMILGGGPNRIGQGIEFDWCCCHAAFALRKMGIEVVMVNSNPETVSTDYDTSDKLYFEPLTFEDVMEIYERERCDGAIVQLGGQTPLNLAERLESAGVKIVGTSPKDIALAEDRDFFRDLVAEVGVKQPPSGIAHSIEDAVNIAAGIGYPVLVRPSFVLGGRGMAIVYHEERLREYVEEAVRISEGRPILIDKFLTHAIELDVDCVSDGETTVVGAILEHIEAAGCHSGDAAAVTPPVSLSQATIAEVERVARTFAERLHVVGLMNMQLAVKAGEAWMIEVNPRASRTVPFVSKAVGWSLAGVATRCMAGEKLKDIGLQASDFREDRKPGAGSPKSPRTYCAKEAVFPFVKFPGADITLTPEMKSTGEVMAFGHDAATAYYKSQIAAGSPLPHPGQGGIVLSVRDEDKEEVVRLAKTLDALGCEIWATRGTSTALWKAGIESNALYRITLGSPNALDLIRLGKVKWIVNTREDGEMAAHDSLKIRSAAVAAGIPVTTTLAGFAEAINGIAVVAKAPPEPPAALQEWHSPR